MDLSACAVRRENKQHDFTEQSVWWKFSSVSPWLPNAILLSTDD